MNSIGIASIMFVCAFAGSLLGMLMRRALPGHHLSGDSKDLVRQGVGLIATMSALVLGLLVASAKSSYDTAKGEIVQMSSKIIFLDRLLAMYGTGAADARKALRAGVVSGMNHIWPQEQSQMPDLDPAAASSEQLYPMLQQLNPENDAQRTLKANALTVAADLGQTRWLLFGGGGSSISVAFLAVVIFWSTVIFISFGLFAPRNLTVIFTLFLCAISLAAAIFLILELDHPFSGLIQISSEPMKIALEHLGR